MSLRRISVCRRWPRVYTRGMRVLHQLSGLLQAGLTVLGLWMLWPPLGGWAIPVAFGGAMIATYSLLVGLGMVLPSR